MTPPLFASGAPRLVLPPRLAFVLLSVWAACSPEAEPARAVPEAPGVVAEASTACLGGGASAAIPRLD